MRTPAKPEARPAVPDADHTGNDRPQLPHAALARITSIRPTRDSRRAKAGYPLRFGPACAAGHQSRPAHAHGQAPGDDEVIEEVDFHCPRDRAKPARGGDIRLARAGIAGRMVVNEDKPRRIVIEDALEQRTIAPADRCARPFAAGQAGNQYAVAIEQECNHDFMAQPADLAHQRFEGRPG